MRQTQQAQRWSQGDEIVAARKLSELRARFGTEAVPEDLSLEDIADRLETEGWTPPTRHHPWWVDYAPTPGPTYRATGCYTTDPITGERRPILQVVLPVPHWTDCTIWAALARQLERDQEG